MIGLFFVLLVHSRLIGRKFDQGNSNSVPNVIQFITVRKAVDELGLKDELPEGAKEMSVLLSPRYFNKADLAKLLHATIEGNTILRTPADLNRLTDECNSERFKLIQSALTDPTNDWHSGPFDSRSLLKAIRKMNKDIESNPFFKSFPPRIRAQQIRWRKRLADDGVKPIAYANSEITKKLGAAYLASLRPGFVRVYSTQPVGDDLPYSYLGIDPGNIANAVDDFGKATYHTKLNRSGIHEILKTGEKKFIPYPPALPVAKILTFIKSDWRSVSVGTICFDKNGAIVCQDIRKILLRNSGVPASSIPGTKKPDFSQNAKCSLDEKSLRAAMALGCNELSYIWVASDPMKVTASDAMYFTHFSELNPIQEALSLPVNQLGGAMGCSQFKCLLSDEALISLKYLAIMPAHSEPASQFYSQLGRDFNIKVNSGTLEISPLIELKAEESNISRKAIADFAKFGTAPISKGDQSLFQSLDEVTAHQMNTILWVTMVNACLHKKDWQTLVSVQKGPDQFRTWGLFPTLKLLGIIKKYGRFGAKSDVKLVSLPTTDPIAKSAIVGFLNSCNGNEGYEIYPAMRVGISGPIPILVPEVLQSSSGYLNCLVQKTTDVAYCQHTFRPSFVNGQKVEKPILSQIGSSMITDQDPADPRTKSYVAEPESKYLIKLRGANGVIYQVQIQLPDGKTSKFKFSELPVKVQKGLILAAKLAKEHPGYNSPNPFQMQGKPVRGPGGP